MLKKVIVGDQELSPEAVGYCSRMAEKEKRKAEKEKRKNIFAGIVRIKLKQMGFNIKTEQVPIALEQSVEAMRMMEE